MVPYSLVGFGPPGGFHSLSFSAPGASILVMGSFQFQVLTTVFQGEYRMFLVYSDHISRSETSIRGRVVFASEVLGDFEDYSLGVGMFVH